MKLLRGSHGGGSRLRIVTVQRAGLMCETGAIGEKDVFKRVGKNTRGGVKGE